MVTASHNPSKYNGYKVYGADGCQITTEAAAEILAEIEKLDIFADVKTSDFEAGVANGSIQYISDEVYSAIVQTRRDQRRGSQQGRLRTGNAVHQGQISACSGSQV